MHLPGGKHVNFLSGFPNSHRAARNVFCHRRNVTIQRLVIFGVNEDVMHGIFDFAAWTEWIRTQDSAWLFLLILVLVIAVVVVWSSTLRANNTREQEDDESRT